MMRLALTQEQGNLRHSGVLGGKGEYDFLHSSNRAIL